MNNSLVLFALLFQTLYAPYSMAQPVPNPGPSSSSVVGGDPTPNYPPAAQQLIDWQEQLLQQTFCLPASNGVYLLSLDVPALDGLPAYTSHPELDAGLFEPVIAVKYDLQAALAEGEITAAEYNQLTGLNAHIGYVMGDLTGPCGTVAMFGLAFSIDDGIGGRVHALMPVRRNSSIMNDFMNDLRATGPHVVDSFAANLLQDDPILPEPNDPDCNDTEYCANLYNDGLGVLLADLKKCTSSIAAPLGIGVVLAVIGCGISGFFLSPLFAAGCIAVVLTAAATISMAQFSGCHNTASQARFDNSVAYCDCMAWKAANCPNPNFFEIEVFDCLQ